MVDQHSTSGHGATDYVTTDRQQPCFATTKTTLLSPKLARIPGHLHFDFRPVFHSPRRPKTMKIARIPIVLAIIAPVVAHAQMNQIFGAIHSAQDAVTEVKNLMPQQDTAQQQAQQARQQRIDYLKQHPPCNANCPLDAEDKRKYEANLDDEPENQQGQSPSHEVLHLSSLREDLRCAERSDRLQLRAAGARQARREADGAVRGGSLRLGSRSAPRL